MINFAANANDMEDKQTIILSSTHLDSQGYMMTKEALEGSLKFLNGNRRVKLGVEHIRSFPPFGAIVNGKIVQGKDDAFYLIGEAKYFDSLKTTTLEDGTVLLKECFKEGNKAFWESQVEEITKLEISTDPANFEGRFGFKELMDTLRTDSELDFDEPMIGRKSELADPEFIIRITEILALALGLVATKIPEKLSETIGEDLGKFYKLITRSALEMIKHTIPANRPKNFVIEYNYANYLVELIITTNVHDDVLNAVSKEKLKPIREKIQLLKNLNPEKIQFLFNEENEWEFNYLLTAEGEAIGKEKAFKKRNDLYQKLLTSQK
jgi:hypothetical protein